MRMRFAALEDGGRLYTGTIMGPEAIWPGVEDTVNASIWSPCLADVRGPTVPPPTTPAEPT